MSSIRKPAFGYIRELPSGRFQARYPAPDTASKELVTLGTYPTWKAANTALQKVRAEITLNIWEPSTASKIRFGQFFREQYLAHARLTKAVRTVEGYESLAKRHLLPYFESQLLRDITEESVERWYHGTMRDKGAVTRRNSYMLLRAVLRLALRRKAIRTMPCDIENGSANAASERPHLPFDLWQRIVGEMNSTTQPMAWLMLGGHLRVGEVIALRRSDYDATQKTLRVERQIVAARGGPVVTPTKTKNSRIVRLLSPAADALDAYLMDTPRHGENYIFSRDDRPLTAAFLRRQWNHAREIHHATAYHLYDGKHVGLTLVASTGAPIKQIQMRAGHSTSAASLRYQQASARADADIVAALDQKLKGTA